MNTHLKHGAAATTLIFAFFGAAEANPPEKAPEKVEAAAPADVEIHPDSPRASMTSFLELVAEKKNDEAVKYLQLPPPLSPEKGAELAAKLGAVLNSERSFDLGSVSSLADGDPNDGLPEGRDRVARVHVPEGGFEPVRMVKADHFWQFTPRTVTRADVWYAQMPTAWAEKNLPAWMSKPGPAGLKFWQWASLLGIAVAAWIIGFIFSRMIFRWLAAWAKKTKTSWDDRVLALGQGPLTLAAALAVAAALLSWLDFPQPARGTLFGALKGGFLIVLFWICLRAVDVARELLAKAKFAHKQPAARSLVSLGARLTKAVLGVVLIIGCLSLLGLPVTSLIAGLGIGGLAVALAGQKTLENLIGTFAIGIDRPFREGDFVKVRDFTATVESIGLRSTRFRTADRTIITVPNGKLADEQIETFAVRDRLRFFATLELKWGDAPDQPQATLAALENDLKTKWKELDPGSVLVRLVTVKDGAGEVEIEAMAHTLDVTELAALRQDILLRVRQLEPVATVQAPDPAKNLRASGSRHAWGH